MTDLQAYCKSECARVPALEGLLAGPRMGRAPAAPQAAVMHALQPLLPAGPQLFVGLCAGLFTVIRTINVGLCFGFTAAESYQKQGPLLCTPAWNQCRPPHADSMWKKKVHRDLTFTTAVKDL